MYNLPRLNHEECENQNRLITSKEIESVVKTSQQTKVQNQMVSLVNSPKYSKYIKYKEDRTLQNSYYEASITLITKSDKMP